MIGRANSAGAFHASAFDTSYAMIVPEKQLPRANGMMLVVAIVGGILVILCLAQMFNPYLLRVEDRDFLEALAAQAECKKATVIT